MVTKKIGKNMEIFSSDYKFEKKAKEWENLPIS
jgi:hypothetical protein